MARSIDDLLRLWIQRENHAGPKKSRDRETLEMFEGRLAVPLPEIDRSEKPAVANLMFQGITAQAQRIASQQPQPVFPVSSPSKAAAKRAKDKKRATQGVWDENRLYMQDQQWARWMLAYASAPTIVRPAMVRGQWTVKWAQRSPLSCYPASTPSHLDMQPADVLFASSHNASTVERGYAHMAPIIRAARGYSDVDRYDHPTTLVEYYGPDEIVLFCVGRQNDQTNMNLSIPYADGKWAVELERIDNRVGRCSVIVPNAISLEQPMSKYEGLKGMYQMQARLMALEYRYVANTVDPAVWFVEADTGGEIVTVADGPAGIVGHVRGGQLTPLNPPPGVGTNNMIDRLERGQRLEGGIPADLGGESATNIRTGVRGQNILEAVLDFPIQESQMVRAESRRLEDELFFDIALEYFPDMKRSWGGFEFTPSKTFERNEFHEVRFSLPGTDANGLVIRMGQLNGTGLMSKRTAMENIPDIVDPEFEHDQVVAEQIEQGILAEFMQPGSFTLPDKARVMELVAMDKLELADAILKVQKEAQERQSQTVDPAAPGSPETMPGIAPPGAGAEAGVAQPAGGLDGLSSLLTQLRAPQQFTTPQERVAEAGASLG